MFNNKNVREHFLIIKESIHQENMAILNIYAPYNWALNYMKHEHTKLKREIDN